MNRRDFLRFLGISPILSVFGLGHEPKSRQFISPKLLNAAFYDNKIPKWNSAIKDQKIKELICWNGNEKVMIIDEKRLTIFQNGKPVMTLK